MRESQHNYIFADFGENNTASVIYRQIRKKKNYLNLILFTWETTMPRSGMIVLKRTN